MRKSPFKDTFNRFYTRMVWYIDFLEKISNAKRVTLTPTEKKEILEAFVFKVYVTWEILVQDLLIDCLNQDTSQYAKHKNTNLPRYLSRNVCKNFISGLDYFNFTDTDDIKGKARKILVFQYNPFDNKHKEIREVKDDIKKIDEFREIRNYLAHYSSHSKQKLLAIYKSKYSLEKFCEPGNFLSAFDKKTEQTRFRNYTKAFFNAANAMDEFLIRESEKS